MRLSLESPVEEATDVPVAVAAPVGAIGRVSSGSSGVEGACAWRQGFLRELGRSAYFHGQPAARARGSSLSASGGRLEQTPRPRNGASGVAGEQNLRGSRGTARVKETKPGGRSERKS